MNKSFSTNKPHYYYKYFLTFISRISSKGKFQLVFFLAFVIFVGVFGFFAVKYSPVFFKPVVKQGIVGTYTESDLPEMVTKLLSSGLVRVDQSGTPQPELAASWEATSEGKIYNVSLRKDITWVDGTPVTADSFSVPFKEGSDEREKNIEQKVIDGATIQFALPDGFSPFPTLLNRQIFKNGTWIGTGPYTISRVKKDGIFVKELVLDSKMEELPRVVVRFYPSEKTAKNALRLGEIQALMGVNEPGELSSDRIYKLKYHTNYQQLVTIFFNTADPVLSDENLRLALSYSAPTIEGEIEARTSISPESWAFNSEVKDYLGNEEAAKLAMKKVQNADKVKSETITLTATPYLMSVGEQVIAEWKKLGINAVLRVEAGVPQNFQALLITQNIPTDPDQYALWHSTQTQTNITKYANPRVDKDLEDGRQNLDLAVRKQKYQDFQKVLLDHAPAAFLYFPKYNILYMKKIEPQLQQVINLQFR